jgi:hypothetical protein
MARKPHNYTHFQSLVNELKEQNENNFAGLQSHLAVQTDVLQGMKGFLLKGVQQDQADNRREKEDRLEGKKKTAKGKDWDKKKLDLPRFSGKGFMGMLGNFLSTALIGIPGGLRRFLPAALGLGLIPKLAQGVALMVAGPSLIKALEAGFSKGNLSDGVVGFIDSYFSSGGEPFKSLAGAAMGTAGKGALIGFGLGGPRGAIIAGILSGALGGLNHIFAEDKSKMNSADVMTRVKTHLMTNIGKYAAGGGALMGAKWGLAGGPAGMIAGAILGGGIGFIGSGLIKEMMSPDLSEKDVGVQFKEGLKNWYMKMDWGTGIWPAGLGAAFGAATFSKFGPHAMLAGGIFGAAAGLLGGPILSEALRIDKAEGKGMANAMKTATWNYIVKQAKNPYVTSAIAGATAGGILGSVGTLPGMIAGTVIGAVFGIISQWLTNIIGKWAGDQFDKAFGIKKLVNPHAKEIAKAQADFKKELADQSPYTKLLLRAGKQSNPGGDATKLQNMYNMLKSAGPLAGTDQFDEKSAKHASNMIDSKFHLIGNDSDKTNESETQAIRLREKREIMQRGVREREASNRGNIGTTGMNIFSDSSSRSTINSTPDNAFPNLNGGMIDSIA